MKTETTADLNVAHECRSRAAAEGYERRETELRRGHEEDKAQLTERFRAARDVLQVKGSRRVLPQLPQPFFFSAAFVLHRRLKRSS